MRGYVRRITQKAEKLSKEQLLDLLNKVVDENDNFASILDSITAGLLIVDNNFILLQSNAIIESHLCFSIDTDDPKAYTVPVWELIGEEEIADYLKNIAAKSITNATEEFSFVTSGGSVRFISVTISPLIQKNQVNGRIITVRDITDKKNQDILLHRMENMANLTNLAAGMAHEIKNPLGAISIHIQLLQKAVKKARENQNVLPPKKFVEDHIDVVNDEINHLNKLIMDFLFAVRPVNASLELKNPSKLIKPMVDFIKPEFKDNGIEINFNVKDNDCKILVDEKLLRDVFMNLSQNALAAIKQKLNDNPSFAGAAKLEISCFVNENKYFLIFTDNGCGMKSETISKIFEPYFTTKANGTGLGMTTVYKIVKEFSGEINVDSEEGKGTCFTLEFPLQLEEKLAIGN